MKSLKYLSLSLVVCGATLSSCDDFFDTKPYDQLSPSTFWQTEEDVQSAVTACYDKWNEAKMVRQIFFMPTVFRILVLIIVIQVH